MYSSRLRTRLLTPAMLYLLIIAAAVSIATIRARAQGEGVPGNGAADSGAPRKPYFSLSTNRTYGSADRVRVWINYQGIEHLDFRVYRVNDPVKFFKQLKNPHRMGKEETREVAASLQRGPSAIEKIRTFKVSIYKTIRNYFRSQLKRESRESFNHKFRGEGDRAPLNVADYARVPLLNPDQLVSAWREQVPPLDNEYDTRMVMLGKRDPGVYLVEAVNDDLRAYTIAVVSDLTLVSKTAPSGEMLVYAVDRKSGAPRNGVNVEVAKLKNTVAKGATDREGLLKTRVEPIKAAQGEQEEEHDPEAEDESGSTRNAYLVMARDRDHFSIADLPAYYFTQYNYGSEGEEGEAEGGASLTGYVYTDRPVYRPAQKVYFKGILRRGGDNGYEIPQGTVNVTIEDPNGGKVQDKELSLSSRGSFFGDLDVAPGAALGSYRVIASSGSGKAIGYFEVAEYKKPEYKVTVSAPKKFAKVGEKIKFSVEAKYFFGEPVTNADVTYYVYRSRYYHWWEAEDDDAISEETEDQDEGGYGYGNDLVKDGELTLSKDGKADVEFEVPAPEEKDPWDYTYRLEAQVTDQSRRTVEGRASFVGTRGNIVASTRTDRYVYYEGDTAKIQVTTTDYEGRPQPASLTLRFVKRTWDRIEKEDEDGKKRYEYTPRESSLASADLNTDQQGMARYEFQVPGPGSIYIEAVVKEGGKQFVSDTNYLWVADRKDQWGDWAYEDYGSIKLVPDKKSYQPGETAHVLAMLPAEKAHLLVTTELGGVLTARHVQSTARAIMLDVPIESRYVPNVYLGVCFVKDGEMFTHDRLLNVPAKKKFLNIEILADKKEYKPRDTARYTVLARNADGSAASGAEVSLGIVDEAIYSVRPEQTRDIRKAFYGRRYNQVQTNFTISYFFTGHSGDKPFRLASNKRAYQLADFKDEAQYAEATIRKDFRDTTFWQPDLMTGSDGKVSIDVKLPDNLTTWRATARAVTADTRVGSAVGKVVARKDLILRLETPRFLTEGDTVTLSAIVHNYLDSDKSTQISIEVNGGQLLDQAKTTVTIPRKGEHRVDWRIAAPQIGEVKLLAKGLTDKESDGVELTLPVVPHGLKRSVAETATLSDPNAEKSFSLDLPANANAQARSLRIEASPSLAGTMFGALDYLTSYPYGCTEQTMSSFLPNVVVAQTLKEIQSTSIRGSNDLGKKVQRGLDRLYGFQHDDGGWGWWKDDKTDPFMTAYVVDGLMLASRAGYGVDMNRISRGREKLRTMIDSGKMDDGKSIDAETRAFMIYAFGESGSSNPRYLNDLFSRRGELQPYGRALLALALKMNGDERARQVAGEIESSARSNEFDAHWESRRRPMLDFTEEIDTEATALSLKALARIQPSSRLLPKVARWLVSSRPNGYYWESTKQTAFAILGLTDYLKVSKELQPDYALEVYLNGEQVLNKRVTSADTTSSQGFVVERKGSAVGGSSQIKVVKRGQGVLYVATSLEYFTKEDEIAAQQTAGLSLTREYLRLRVTENPGGEARWTAEPLKGEIRSGDLLVVRLRARGARARYLMIEDPIPAGCEQVERVSGIDLTYSTYSWSDWYSAREFRDQRTVLFLDYFDGDATFQYALRVQVPGDFRVAPSRAELMYQPSVQANTVNSKMTILDK